ncbi:MAG: NAD(P)-dependent oxidoreductase [Acidimicrobiales bacterium]|jgi:3-hydroxyisobutyrate dehydrogenase
MAIAAFIGLGNMGYPMAGHLAAAGHEVRVFNRTQAKAEQWAGSHTGTACSTPAEAAAGADFVALCVGADADVRAVSYGDDGVLATMAQGAVLVDHTTASAELARELGEACAAKNIGFVDAPISGGQAGAEKGALSVMCGGAEADFDKALPLVDAYSSAVTLVGDVGSGQLTKMCNQILCAGAIQGAAEAIAFGQKAGLDMSKVLAAVTKGAAGSWYLSNRGETMVNDEFDFGFAVDWMAKDLGLVQEEASALGAETPLTALVSGYLKATQDAGENRMDATAIVRRYRS